MEIDRPNTALPWHGETKPRREEIVLICEPGDILALNKVQLFIWKSCEWRNCRKKKMLVPERGALTLRLHHFQLERWNVEKWGRRRMRHRRSGSLWSSLADYFWRHFMNWSQMVVLHLRSSFYDTLVLSCLAQNVRCDVSDVSSSEATQRNRKWSHFNRMWRSPKHHCVNSVVQHSTSPNQHENVPPATDQSVTSSHALGAPPPNRLIALMTWPFVLGTTAFLLALVTACSTTSFTFAEQTLFLFFHQPCFFFFFYCPKMIFQHSSLKNSFHFCKILISDHRNRVTLLLMVNKPGLWEFDTIL